MIAKARARWAVWTGLLIASAIAAWMAPDDSPEPEPDAPAIQQRAAHARANSPVGRSSTARSAASAAPEQADLFSVKRWHVEPATPELVQAPAAIEVPEPAAQALPYQYVGHVTDGEGNWIVQLSKGADNMIAGKGDVLDDVYRLEDFKDGVLTFTYLPAGIQLQLIVPSDS